MILDVSIYKKNVGLCFFGKIKILTSNVFIYSYFVYQIKKKVNISWYFSEDSVFYSKTSKIHNKFVHYTNDKIV